MSERHVPASQIMLQAPADTDTGAEAKSARSRCGLHERSSVSLSILSHAYGRRKSETTPESPAALAKEHWWRKWVMSSIREPLKCATCLVYLEITIPRVSLVYPERVFSVPSSCPARASRDPCQWGARKAGRRHSRSIFQSSENLRTNGFGSRERGRSSLWRANGSRPSTSSALVSRGQRGGDALAQQKTVCSPLSVARNTDDE